MPPRRAERSAGPPPETAPSDRPALSGEAAPRGVTEPALGGWQVSEMTRPLSDREKMRLVDVDGEQFVCTDENYAIELDYLKQKCALARAQTAPRRAFPLGGRASTLASRVGGAALLPIPRQPLGQPLVARLSAGSTRAAT